MQIYLIRHPEPRDALALCYGRLDLAVDPEAIANAAVAVRRHIPALVLQHAPIYTSPLSRCVGLARELAERRKTITADELVEIDFGSWEGRSWDAVPRVELDAWARDVWGYRPGGGENALAVAARWQRWLERTLRTSRGAVIAVTHAGVIRVALAQTGRLARAECVLAPIEFGSVHTVVVREPSSASPQRVEAP